MNNIESWTLTHGGIGYRVTLEEDHDSRPYDADCYSEEDIASWKRDEWEYVGVIVQPLIAGLDPEYFEASVWGVEYGDLARVTIDREHINRYQVPDLITAVSDALAARLSEVRDSLAYVVSLLA